MHGNETNDSIVSVLYCIDIRKRSYITSFTYIKNFRLNFRLEILFCFEDVFIVSSKKDVVT